MDDDSGLIEEPVYLILEDALEIYRPRATDRELAEWIISLSRGTSPEQLAETLRDRLTGVASGG